MDSDSGLSTSRLFEPGLYVGLALLTAAVYLHVPDLGFFAEWDDRLYMVARPEVRDWFGATWRQRLLTPELGYPVPVPTFVYYLLRQLPSESVVLAGHVTSGFVHLLNVLLVYTNARRRADHWRVAFLASAFWAAHPLLVESVAWLTNLKGLLATTFVFGAFWVWDRYCEEPSTVGLVWTALFIVFGLGCRPEVAVATPLLLGELYLRRREAFESWRTRVFAGAMLALGAAYAVVAVAGQFSVFARANVSPPPELSLLERLTRIGAAFALQLRHVVQPLDLHPSYPAESIPLVREAWIGAALFALLAAATWYTVRRIPSCGWGWAIWWGFYLPASGIVFLPRFTADTYMYIPLFGLLFALTAFVDGVLESRRRRVRVVAGGAAAIFVCVLGFRAHTQTLRWRNKMTLWKPVVDQRPDDVRANWMVGAAYFQAGKYERALERYERVYRQVARRGRIPLRMARAYEKTGEVERAATVAAKILQYEGKTPPETAHYLVELVASHEMDVDDGSPVGRALEDAAKLLLETPAGELEPEICADAAEWFADFGRSGLAAAFARRAVRGRPETCRAWEVLEREGGGGTGDLPERPEVCR